MGPNPSRLLRPDQNLGKTKMSRGCHFSGTQAWRPKLQSVLFGWWTLPHCGRRGSRTPGPIPVGTLEPSSRWPSAPWHGVLHRVSPCPASQQLNADDHHRAGGSLKRASALAPSHPVTKQQASRAMLKTYLVPTKNSEKTQGRRDSHVPSPSEPARALSPLLLKFSNLLLPTKAFPTPLKGSSLSSNYPFFWLFRRPQSLCIFPSTCSIWRWRHSAWIKFHVNAEPTLVRVKMHKKKGTEHKVYLGTPLQKRKSRQTARPTHTRTHAHTHTHKGRERRRGGDEATVWDERTGRKPTPSTTGTKRTLFSMWTKCWPRPLSRNRYMTNQIHFQLRSMFESRISCQVSLKVS